MQPLTKGMLAASIKHLQQLKPHFNQGGDAMVRSYRWVPKQYAPIAVGSGLVSHNESAMWIFNLTNTYRPSNNISHGAILIAYDLSDFANLNITTRELINFEADSFEGEGAHPRQVIIKNNEPGAYGLGKMRQKLTNFHTTTRYAKKAEVAKALGLKPVEVNDNYKPAGGWPPA
ncbi:hypothetical protein [Pseudomonas thivervalensis]|uniref:hypothetical protein n=1 Tax=Pseudomonas thivervalensis TaxID=86265 RepID=UPI00129035AF|nr:hypothetical protein [Pseudomonas thivervalensis]